MKMPKLMRKLQTATKNSHFRVLSFDLDLREETRQPRPPAPPLSLSPVPPRCRSTPALHTAAAPQRRRSDGACSPGRRLVSPDLDIVRGGAGTARLRRCLLCVMRSATIASTPTGQGGRGVWGFVFPTQAKTLLEFETSRLEQISSKEILCTICRLPTFLWPGVSLASVFPLWTHMRLRSWLVVEESIARINQRKDVHKVFKDLLCSSAYFGS
ncbi:uncharacterized protein [Triticum aestivum]|uniref:uncharacterized protein isoform X2 n=1 Tax=Triticum aestivum TaxID=4565 RepID=UPI001D00CC43|nr:uncharacterized protein LOC123169444 isoform X2 [Triticum aestivum]